MKTDLHHSLEALGFGKHEIQAYLTLLKRGALSGYQLAKLSRIPRPNIYPILERLKARGVVSEIKTGDGLAYAALPVDEMLSRLSRDFQSRVGKAKDALRELETAPEEEALTWNIRGYDSVMAKAEMLIHGSKKHVLAGLWSQESERLSLALAATADKQIPLTILCIQGCAQDCGNCCGAVYRYALASAPRERWLFMVADHEEIFIARIPEAGEATGAFSKSAVMITLVDQYLKNGIAVAEIVRSLGPRLLELVDAQALEALKSAGLATDNEAWFSRLLQTVRSSQSA